MSRTSAIRITSADGIDVGGLLTRPPARTKGTLSGTGVVLAHGAGGDMRAPLLAAAAEGLADAGATVLRFDFPYRHAKKKLPDPTAKLEAALHHATARLRSTGVERLVLGGKSMGGRMATHVAAKGEACAGIVLFGYPLHPAGKPEKLRDAHLPQVPVPMLFVQGTRDALCDLALLRPVLARVGPRATLHVIEGGDHSLEVRGRKRGEVQAEILRVVIDWILRVAVSGER